MRDQDLANVIVFAFFVTGFVITIFYFYIKQERMLCFRNKEEDDGRIVNGTITTEGSFLEKYNYLNNYIGINE